MSAAIHRHRPSRIEGVDNQTKQARIKFSRLYDNNRGFTILQLMGRVNENSPEAEMEVFEVFAEMRSKPKLFSGKYKVEFCRNVMKNGDCPFGPACFHAHTCFAKWAREKFDAEIAKPRVLKAEAKIPDLSDEAHWPPLPSKKGD